MQTIVFLGIFDKIANWIFSGIAKAITWLVSNIIAPVCSVIWENFIAYIWQIVYEYLCVILYKIYAYVLTILYALETAVYSFGGAKEVTYGGESGNILTLFFSTSSVKNAFVYITAISVVLLFLFTVVAVTKSSVDFNFDRKKSVSVIMTNFATSCIIFLILPVFCYGLIDLSSRCMSAFYKATSMSGNISITDNLYLMSVKSSIGTGSEDITQANYDALSLALQKNEMLWYNLSDVKPYIVKATNVDYIVGYIGALLLIINLLGVCAVFVQRLIEVILLYIASPFFAATMPLDDGERFGRWRRTFIGRICMGVGMIIALNVVMIVISVVITGSDGYTISFTKTNTSSLLSIDTLLKLIFMIGAILSVKNVGNTITAIIDRETAGAQQHAYMGGIHTVMSAPQRARAAVGTVSAMATRLSSVGSGSLRSAGSNALKNSKAQGFKGNTANGSELAFANGLRSQNRENSFRAAFTKRGAKYSAINSKIDSGNKILRDFTGLKTHEERAKFMADFNKNGGFNALKVDGNKFGSSDMTNMKERSNLSNLSKRMEIAKHSRDKFARGTAQWDKYNNQLNNMTKLKKEYDNLNTHKERESFAAMHTEFGKIDSKSSDEKKASSNIEKRMAQVKAYRDSLPSGSAEWKAADARYKALSENQIAFEAAATSEERTGIMNSSAADFAPSLSNSENIALLAVGKKMSNAIKTRDMFKKNSAEWNKYNKDVTDLNKSIDKFNTAPNETARKELLESDPSFKKEAKMSSAENRAVKNIDKNISRIRMARDRNAAGTAEWNKFNTMLDAYAGAKHDLVNGDTAEDRAAVMSNNSSMFEDNTSDKENSAMQVLNSKLLMAENNRNMFEKGSREWTVFDNQMKNLVQLGNEMQGISSKSSREAFISEHKTDFSNAERMSFKNSKQMSGINSNIARATANRDRHKVGSDKWNACNNEVMQLRGQRAQFESLNTTEERNAFAASHEGSFKDNLADDKKFKEIENSRQNWMGLAQSTNSPEVREHAYKMAKAYTDFSEEYQRAESGDIRQAVADKIDSYEGRDMSRMGGVTATPKEIEGMSVVMGTKNEVAVSRYVNAASHAERSQILNDAKSGKISRYEMPSGRENDFSGSIASAGVQFATMASEAKNETEAARYTALNSFCTDAAQKFKSLPTHAQREYFANYVNNEVQNAQNGLSASIESPQIASSVTKTLDYSYDEECAYSTYFSGDEDYERTHEFRTAFANADSHEMRNDIMQRYSDYIANADEQEKPGVWNKMDLPKFSVERPKNVPSAAAGQKAPNLTEEREQRAQKAKNIVQQVRPNESNRNRNTTESRWKRK